MYESVYGCLSTRCSMCVGVAHSVKVYPPPTTPPEPAPPDHLVKISSLQLGSNTSLDEITCIVTFF
ncbi:hypothetical protein J6590_026152 [Homalodisca vitripennis]|nr:hypothetical protein J6590_026152 [Homalodisca vitripennis]